MATAAQPSEQRRLSGYFNGDDQRQMSADDFSAGRSVSLILLALITAGMVAMAVTVGFVWATL